MRVYLDPRVLRIFLLGIASGFPWVMIGSVLTLWLKDAGLSRTDIGFAGAIFAVYSINFLWAPLLDRYQPLEFLGFGRRKSWIVLALAAMALSCFAVGLTDPLIDAKLTVMCCLLIAICSATQDISIDAYRIDSIPESESHLIPAAAAMATAGWWTGFSGLGAAALFLSDMDAIGWTTLYQICALTLLIINLVVMAFPNADSSKQITNSQSDRDSSMKKYIALVRTTSVNTRALAVGLTLVPIFILLWVIAGTPLISENSRGHVLFVPVLFAGAISALILSIHLLTTRSKNSLEQYDIEQDKQPADPITYVAAYILSTLGQPFASFFQKSGVSLAARILLFIFLFKIGEAFLGRMSVLFYNELGFSNSEIAQYSKLLSWWVTISVSLLGGWFTIRYGMIKGLFLAGVAMAASNCMFSIMAIAGPEHWLFAITVIIDGITSAWSSVAFVAFISVLVDRNYSASQYALFASLGTMGRTVLSTSSGSWVDALGGNWAIFFFLTAVMVIPALLLLRSIAKHPLLMQSLSDTQLSKSTDKSKII